MLILSFLPFQEKAFETFVIVICVHSASYNLFFFSVETNRICSMPSDKNYPY